MSNKIWTVRSSAISSVLENYTVLQETLDAVIEENKRDEIAVKASGALAQMENFHTLFGLYMAKIIFSSTDQAARTLQGKDISAHEASAVISALREYLKHMRDSFDISWRDVTELAITHNIVVSVPRQRVLSKKLDETRTQHTFATTEPQPYYRQQYNIVIDNIVGQLNARFSQSVLDRLLDMEKILLDAANGQLQSVDEAAASDVIQVYAEAGFIDLEKLQSQLKMLPTIIKTINDLNKEAGVAGVGTNAKHLTSISTVN